MSAADFWATSAYKWYGPHLGATVADPALLETLHPDKLLPSTEDVPDRFELGTPAFAQLAGVAAAVDWLADLGHAAAAGASGSAAASPRSPGTSTRCSTGCRTACRRART